MSDGTQIYSVSARVGATVVLSVALLLTVAWLSDPESSTTLQTVLLAVVVIELVLILRATRRGVAIRDDALVSRDWIRTRTFPTESVTYVGTAPYERITRPGEAVPLLYGVFIETGGVRRDLRQLRGIKATAIARAARLQLALNLPLQAEATNDVAER